MTFQNIFHTTVLSIAIAAGSGVAFAGSHTDPEDQGKTHAEANGTMTHDKAQDNSLNSNNVETMKEEASDEVLPNSGSRAVPGAPKAGKNPDIDPAAGEHDFVE